MNDSSAFSIRFALNAAVTLHYMLVESVLLFHSSACMSLWPHSPNSVRTLWRHSVEYYALNGQYMKKFFFSSKHPSACILRSHDSCGTFKLF